MWLQIPPIKFFENNYLVWVYYDTLINLHSQGNFDIFFKAFPELKKDTKLKMIRKFKEFSQTDQSETPIVWSRNEEIVEGHELAAIGLYLKKETILCIKAKKEKHVEQYPKEWLEPKIGSQKFNKLKKQIYG